jgi:multisubunit Na+/H+ antiporter MnhG subunit
MWWIYALILAGSLFILIASIGLIRFKDIYSRMHVTTKASSFGIMLILIGVSLYLNIGEVYLKGIFCYPVCLSHCSAGCPFHCQIKQWRRPGHCTLAGW